MTQMDRSRILKNLGGTNCDMQLTLLRLHSHRAAATRTKEYQIGALTGFSM